VRIAVIAGGLLLFSALHAAWAQAPDGDRAPVKLKIGVLTGAPRPEGFVIEDLRSGAEKAGWSGEISRRSSVRGPLIKFKRNIGEAEMNVAPMELLADKLAERYGDKLRGKKLVVREFSLAAYGEGYQVPTVVAIPLGRDVVGAAIVGTVITNVILQSMATPRTTNLHVTIDADLDGKEFYAQEIGSLPAENPDAKVLRMMEDFFSFAFYRFERSFSLEGEKPAEK
jgi:hypothetical protein